MQNSKKWMFLVCLALFFLVPQVGFANEEGSSGEQEATERWDRLQIEEITVLSRAELVTGQTLHGVVLGLQSCSVLDCQGPRSYLGLPTLGGLIGLGGSLYLTQNGVAPGHTSLMNSATLWGGLLGLRVGELAGVPYDNVVLVAMAGQGLGLAGGWLIGELARPTSGDVAMMNHSAIWTTALVLLITRGVLDLSFSNTVEDVSWIALPAVGATLGALGASAYPMSRARTRVVSAAGAVGALVGLTVPFLIFEDSLSPRVGAAGTALGALGGLGTAWYFTSQWDQEYREAGALHFAVMPDRERHGLSLLVGGQF